MSWFIQDGDRVAINNENHCGIFTVPQGWTRNPEERVKYLTLPEGSKKIGGETEFFSALDATLFSAPGCEEKCNRHDVETYDNGDGYSEAHYFWATDVAGTRVPCCTSKHVSEY